MKYLKTFEKEYIDKKIELLNLKKFLFIKINNTLFVVEIKDIYTSTIFESNISIEYKVLYSINEKMKKPLKMNYSNSLIYDSFKNKIISQSDNLQDSLNDMLTYFNANKYNI